MKPNTPPQRSGASAAPASAPATGGATVARVAVPRPLRRLFDYAAPTGGAPAVGTRVRVPFGSASLVAVVAAQGNESAHALKPVAEVLDAAPLLPPDLLALAEWLAAYYHHPIGETFAAMLPVAARRGQAPPELDELVWQPAHGDALEALKRAPRQRDAYARLRELGGIADADVASVGLERRHLAALRAKGLARAHVVAPCYGVREDHGVSASPAQAAAIDRVVKSLGTPTTHLLDGVTGSGKTEVYLRVIAEVLKRGEQALVLVPEIALTPQTTARFRERFGAAATLHSALSDAQRFDICLKCARGVHRVLIGTRSAVFTPFADLGVVIVDEEHDASFKQQDGLRYSARDVAVKRARLLSIPVVLGSATPSLESLENARRKRYRYAALPERAGAAAMPAYRVVDARRERLDRGFGDSLRSAIASHLAAGSQALVLVNRRGYAPVLLCTKCGWRAQCGHCDAKLVYHRVGRQLRCHHCGRRRSVPAECPNCGSDGLRAVGTGTQRAEEALAEHHPNAPLHRIDRDTVRSARSLDAGLAAIRAGGPAILVGTQMLAKGHHFPNVTLVAVLGADAGFLSADYRAPERTAQLIVQVAGRAGRAERPGEVWIQTFDPDNPNLLALIHAGYHGFAGNERELRAAARMPPFAALALVRAESTIAAAAEALLDDAAPLLATPGVEVLGPAPAPIARRADHHRSQLLVLAPRRRDLHRALTALEQADLKARGVRWAIDVDPDMW